MNLRDQLLAVADAYAATRKIGRKRVSTIVLNRGSKLDQIASGGADINTRIFERAMIWFSDNWPTGVVWPVGVPRPASETDRAATAGPPFTSSEPVSAFAQEAAE